MARTRRLLVLSGVAVLIAALALAVLLAAVSRGFQRDRLRQELAAVASGAFGLPVRIAALEGPLWPRLVLRGVSLGPAEAPLAEADEVALHFRRLEWLRRRVVLSRASARGLRADLAAAWPTRSEDVPTEEAADGSGGLPGVVVEALEVEEASWRWASEAGRASGRLELRGSGLVWPPPEDASPLAQLAVEARVEAEPAGGAPVELSLAGELEGRQLALSRLDLRAGSRRISLDGVGAARLAEGLVEIERLRLLSGEADAPGERGGRLEIVGGIGPRGLRGLRLDAQDLDVALLASLATPPFPLEGRLDLSARLDGDFSKPDVTGSLVWREGRAGAMDALDLRASVESENGALEAELQVERAGTPLAEAQARVPLPFTWAELRAAPEARAELRADALDLAVLAPLLPDEVSSLGGLARIDLSLAGGAPPLVQGRLAVENAVLDLDTQPRANARAERLELVVERLDLEPRRLALSVLRGQGVEVALVPVATAAEEVASPGDSPSGSGPPPRLELARLELADSRLRWLSGEGARLEAGLDLEADRLAWPPPEGRRAVEALRGTANVEVTRKAVQARIELEGALDGSRIELSRLGLRGAGHELGLEGRGLASLGEEVLTIERLALRGPRAELDVSGALGWQGFRGLELRGRGLRVEPLASLADLPFGMGGQLDVAMQLRGALAAPELDARLDWRDARVGAMRGFRVQGEARSDAERLQIELHTERDGRPAGGISASLPFAFDVATLAADPSARVELRSEAFDLGLLEPLLPPGVSDPEGTARIDLSLRGGSPPALAGRLDLEDGSVRVPALDEEQPLAPLALHLALSPEGEGVRLDALDVRTPLGVAEGRGVLHPAAGNDLELTVSELEMGTLAGLLGLGWELGGQVGGRLRVEGALAAPTLEGRVHWEAPRMGLASGERVELEVEADGRQARAEAWVIESGREAVRATARGPVATLLAGRLGPGVEIRVQGDDFQLETLAPILPRRLREVSGRADVALEVRGGARPELHGSVELSDGALRVPLLSHTFAPITGRVRFDRSRIEPLLEVGTPGASGRLSGVLELGEAAEGTLVAALRPQRADLALELEHLPVARSRVLSADAHGSARVVGALDALSLTGEVVLENARLRLPEAEDPILREVRIVASQPRGGLGEVSTGPGVFERSEVQLKVALPRDSWLRGRGIELELAGDVEVRKRPLQATRFSGGVRVLRGRYLLYGRRFDVRAGRATLTGSERFDPRVEVEAHHRVRDVTVIARLTGPISSPQLQLLGDPPMSETDVLSYLMTGRAAEDSDSRGGGFDAAAAQLAAGVAANEALAVLPGGEWVDSVDFRMGEGGSPEEVGVGRYMTRDLFVRYGRGFGEDAHDRIGIELRLSDEWSLESDLATDESAGADLIWSRDF